MTARIKISQAGLSAGVAGVARTDGLATGALVTLEDVSGTGHSTFHLLWGPPEDTTAEASLAATGDPDIWTFSPTALCYGSYEIELRENGVLLERRIFGIRTPANHLLIPALNERASRHAGWDNDGVDQIDLCEQNANDFPLAVLNSFRYAGWWRSLYELYRVVEFGLGSIADHAIPNVKLAQMAANTLKVNPTAGSADAADLTVGTNTVVGRVAGNIVAAAIVNAQIDAAALIALSKLATQGANSVVVNATNASAVPTAVTIGTNAVLGRVAGNIVAAAIVNAQVDPAALIALSKLATQAANSIVANATGGTAVPTAVAAAAETVLGRDASANLAFFGIPFARKRSAITTVQVVTNATTAVSYGASGGFTIPANTLVALTTYRIIGHLRYQRGATATAQTLRQGIFIAGVEQATTGGVSLSTVNGFNGYFQFEAIFTCLTTGAGGTGVCSLRVNGNPATDAPVLDGFPYGTSATFALDTTIANTIEGRASMSAAVAATSITVTAGYIEALP